MSNEEKYTDLFGQPKKFFTPEADQIPLVVLPQGDPLIQKMFGQANMLRRQIEEMRLMADELERLVARMEPTPVEMPDDRGEH